MSQVTKAFILGRREWVALPDLGLPAVKAKVDTGARTSALHAREIEPFGSQMAPRVRFLVHPVPERPEIEVWCEAALLGARGITSSSGETENRFIIETRIKIGPEEWLIELGLTNREGMAHRMLLGRQAIRPGMLVDPANSFLQPKLSPKLYLTRPRAG
jgi:ribosomal protein S6--L-glutamate ligase